MKKRTAPRRSYSPTAEINRDIDYGRSFQPAKPRPRMSGAQRYAAEDATANKLARLTIKLEK